jgi:uncharacterized membrane protein
MALKNVSPKIHGMKNGTHAATSIAKTRETKMVKQRLNGKSARDIVVIAGMGAIAGSRTTLAPALVFPDSKVLTLMAAGETYVDKLPGIGDRIAPAGLISRSISGALTGAIVSRRKRKSIWLGALIGAAAACAGAYVTYYARKKFGKITGTPDPIAGLVEDVAMICLGSILLNDDRI